MSIQKRRLELLRDLMADRDRLAERVLALEEALRETRPYVYNRLGTNDWRSETAQSVLARVDAVLADEEEA